MMPGHPFCIRKKFVNKFHVDNLPDLMRDLGPQPFPIQTLPTGPLHLPMTKVPVQMVPGNRKRVNEDRL